MNSYVTTPATRAASTSARLGGYVTTGRSGHPAVGGYVSLPAGLAAPAAGAVPRIGSYVASDLGTSAEYQLAS